MKSIHITIPGPCQENWDQMLPDQQGKFCLSCQKNVVDFTSLSNREVLEYFSSHTGDTCGRFNDDQLDRQLSAPSQRYIGKWKYLFQILLPTVLAISKAKSQGWARFEQPKENLLKKRQRVQPVSTSQNIAPIKITVVDIAGHPISNVAVASTDNRFQTTSDSLGVFKVPNRDIRGLLLTSPGFQSKTIFFGEPNATIDTLILETTSRWEAQHEKPANDLLPAIQVRLGGVWLAQKAVVRPAKFIDFFKKKMVLQPSTSLKIAPNPIRPGQNFNIVFNVATTGHYLLEILDASGKLITAQPFDIQTKGQAETIDGSRLQQSGIYIINLKNEDNKPVFNGKLVVGYG